MKKVNSKGFTLIELLAVIVIMGILMMVAIPSVSRVIENSRKDTFVDIAKAYANAAQTLWTSDGLVCYTSDTDTEGTISSAVDDGNYYINIDTANKTSYPVLLDQGGKSSWGNRNVKGYVRVNISTNGTGIDARRVTKFFVAITDGTHSIPDSMVVGDTSDPTRNGTSGIESSSLGRGNVFMTTAALQPSDASAPKYKLPQVVNRGTATYPAADSSDAPLTGPTCIEH